MSELADIVNAVRELLARQPGFGAKLVRGTATAPKRSRIEAVSVPVQAGRVRLKGDERGVDPAQRELFDELTRFPFGEHDDLADAAAAGAAFLLTRGEPRVWV